MLALTSGIQAVQPWLRDPEVRELALIVLASPLTSEADLALVALEDRVPERARLALANLRELLAAVPQTPCDMAVDAATLARVADLDNVKGHLTGRCEDGSAVVVMAEGNRCMDLYVQRGRRHIYWSPGHHAECRIHPDAVDMVLERPEVLARIVDVVMAMGLEFYPAMYLSLEDWHLEHAAETLDELAALFS